MESVAVNEVMVASMTGDADTVRFFGQSRALLVLAALVRLVGWLAFE